MAHPPPSPGSGWAPPRLPLPPHRLAKLANALGVSAPLPAMSTYASSSPNTDHPAPSSATALNLVSPAQSKFLLHVIPPLHLPHDAQSPTTELAPPPSAASGYHTQFRRGTLVALQSTLQAQLVLIAREYALPSTIGIVLYLVSPSPSAPQSDSDGTEPGPRLSEGIWKHIWTRVLRVEREETIALSRSGTPITLGLGFSLDPSGPSPPLRPLLTPTRIDIPRPLACPVTPSTSVSTTSSTSDTRFHDKSATTSSPRSEPDTPDTSRSSDLGPPDIELPGLHSPAVIPILAKVEFDIDRRKATWYEPWVRSRRMKRTESRSSRSLSRSHTLDLTSSTEDKRAPYDLKLVQRMQMPPFMRSQDDFGQGDRPTDEEYAPLSESPDADPTICATSKTGQEDPLADVFGTDAEAWTDIHAQSDAVRRRDTNPNMVELALDAASLSALPEQKTQQDVDDLDEVRNIMRRMSRHPLSISIPDSPQLKRRSSPSTAVGKRPMPPPLILAPKSPTNNLIEGMTDLEQEFQRSRHPGEEKRVGTVFEDLDLGLDLGDEEEEYDENDPNDRRRSQYIMKAKLDEIERALAQFSPQQLKTAMLDETSMINHQRNLSIPSQSHSPPLIVPSESALHKVWPSIPYASVAKTVNGSPARPANRPPSPPRLALNGVSTGAPKAFTPASDPLPTVPTESQLRRQELERAMYPASMASPSRQANFTSDSPIPLSPDPFGRQPSVYEADAIPMQSYWDPVAHKISQDPPGSRPSVSSIDDAISSAPPSSRFSADSSGGADGDKMTKLSTPLVSVKGLKKLWRKSKSSSSVFPQPPTPGRASFQSSSSPLPSTPTEQLVAPPLPSVITRGLNGKGYVNHSPLDVESPYPPFPSRPSLTGSRPSSPAVLTAHQEKASIRKSILKSWKTVGGGGSQQTSNGPEPRRSFERPVSDETIKPRQPSVVDGSIPPSPRLPDQYIPSNHVRTGSNFIEHRKSVARSKTGLGHHHPSASHDLLSVIPPARSPLSASTPGSASSSQSQFSAYSRDSILGSPETSQFEAIPVSKAHPN